VFASNAGTIFCFTSNCLCHLLQVNGEIDMKQNSRKKLLLMAVMTAGWCLQPALAQAGNSAHMQIGGQTSRPIGHVEYCERNRSDCSIVTRNDNPVKLTRERWKEMVEVNAFTNASVKPVTDQEYYGVEEYWVYPDHYGDCEDYALMKRAKLMQLGWPASSLLVTVVRQQNGDGHAVLTVRTDRADYVLDNLEGKILQWNETSYTFLKRVASKNSGYWEDIIDNNLVGSVK
jgi:predicted transglutaminase-like cysteine proteinase